MYVSTFKIIYNDSKMPKAKHEVLNFCQLLRLKKKNVATNVNLRQCDKTPPFWVHMLEFLPCIP